MTTSPKGFTQIANGLPPTGPAQINAAELFVENLIGESVPTPGVLPSSGNWVGRSVYVLSSKMRYVCVALPSTWATEVPASINGKVGVAVSSSNSGVTHITFPAGMFSTGPNVQCTLQNGASPSQILVARATGVTATGADIRVYTGDNSSLTISAAANIVAWRAEAAS